MKSYVLHYEEQGNGPVVVLLHGFMASSRYWHKVTALLAKNHRVIAIDLLGFGKSPKPRHSRYDYDAQLASINATLDHIGITEPFKLMGHSMGSLVSLRYAREYPQRVTKLVLTNMPILLNYKDARKGIMSMNILYYVGLRPWTHPIIWPLFRILMKYKLLPETNSHGVAVRQPYIFQNNAASRLRSLRNIIYAAKIQADLAAIDVATTFVTGLYDNKQYIEHLGKLTFQKHITQLKVAGTHHLPLTKPNLIASLV
jgi:pimeloyl-ACP methyl ester carboxylesterase